MAQRTARADDQNFLVSYHCPIRLLGGVQAGRKIRIQCARGSSARGGRPGSIWASLVEGSHGIWGASRHALTVGFLATMLFSMGQRILPAFPECAFSSARNSCSCHSCYSQADVCFASAPKFSRIKVLLAGPGRGSRFQRLPKWLQ